MSMRGRFVWEEYTTADVPAAGKFYGGIAGLKTAPAPFDASYTTLVAKGAPIGGVFPMPEEGRVKNMPPFWLSYIGVDDVDETARRAESLGGKVIKPPADIANGGRFAIVQDPQGAMFAAYASSQPYRPPASVPLGGASWHELITTDFKAAWDFYQKLFGWTVAQDMNMGADGTYRIFSPPGSKDGIGGMYTKAANQPGPPAWLPYLSVADAKSAANTAQSLGAKIIHGPADVPGGTIVLGIDPQGGMFAVHAAKVMKPSEGTKGTKKTSARGAKKTSAKNARKTAKPAARKRAATTKKKVAKKRKAGSKK